MHSVRFEDVTVTSMKAAVFWDVAHCSLVDTDWRFIGAYCLRREGDESFIALMMKVVILELTDYFRGIKHFLGP
jgi:hypothetical protein